MYEGGFRLSIRHEDVYEKSGVEQTISIASLSELKNKNKRIQSINKLDGDQLPVKTHNIVWHFNQSNCVCIVSEKWRRTTIW